MFFINYFCKNDHITAIIYIWHDMLIHTFIIAKMHFNGISLVFLHIHTQPWQIKFWKVLYYHILLMLVDIECKMNVGTLIKIDNKIFGSN